MKGIYSITNTITNEKYIGEARDVAKGWQQHIKQLELNSHHSYKLQESYNKYSITVFTFNVLEIIPVSNSEAKTINCIRGFTAPEPLWLTIAPVGSIVNNYLTLFYFFLTNI